jgi:F0F1-type ATP synthase assembly protein I
MLQALVKALVSGVIVAVVSETARRNAALGALIASLPIISVLGMIWLWQGSHDPARLAAHSSATFWYVLPSLPMFLVMPWLWRHGLGFWPGLAMGCMLTMALYIVTTALLARFGITI